MRPAEFADYEQIARLHARHGLAAPPTAEEWSHLWLRNPVYRELSDGWPIGWVLEDDNRRVVGSISNIPLAYRFAGRSLLAASGRGWVADPAYRSASLLLLDAVINQPGIDLYINTTFSVASQPAVTVFQCARVPVGIWDRSAFWVTHYRGFARRLLAATPWSLPAAVSYPLATALFMKARLTGKGPRRHDVEVRASPSFDRRFDAFWGTLEAGHPRLLLAVRSRETLAWHFRYALLHRRLWIATVTDGDRIAAYALFDRRDGAGGLTRVRLVDYQSLDGGTALLVPLLAWALEQCQAEGIHVLESCGRWLARGELLDAMAPFHRRLPAWLFVYRANTPWLADALKDPAAWAPFLYDGDASLTR